VTSNTGNSQNPVIAVDGSGTVYVSWQDDLYGNNEIFVKKTADGGATWTGPYRVTNNGGNSRNPALLVDGSGTVYVAWQDDMKGNNDIYMKKSSDGGATWAGPYRITNNAGNSQNPVLAVDNAGAVYVAWQDDLYGNNDIYVKKTADGGATWAGPYWVTNTTGNSQKPVQAVDSTGTVYTAWQGDVNGNNEIFVKKSTDGGATWGAPYRVTNNTGNSRNPVLGADNAGAVYVAWQDDLNGNNDIYMKKSSDGGATWAGPYRVTSNAGNSQNPVLAVDSVGTVYVAWQDDVNGNNDIYVKKTADGGATWAGPYRVTSNAGNSQNPVLAVDGNNTVYVTWQDDQYVSIEAFSKNSADGGLTWSGPYRVADYTGNSAGPSMR
jgi:protein-S-isoprenylcysteine O-methyltransferase Ste14